MTRPLRMGLAGTGHWARITHAPAVAASGRWTLDAVWGRDAEAAAALASNLPGALATDDFDAFLESVDAVTFALPSHVQAPLALRAIAAGRHVLLEKPLSFDTASADELVAAADRRGISTSVFFTMLFDPRVRAIIAEQAGRAPLRGGAGLWLGSALADANPFNTPWRRERGALWDLGPHALAILWQTVGPIIGIRAHAGAADLCHLVLTHATGATSSVTVTLQAPEAADGFTTTVWGDEGRIEIPVDDVDAVAALTLALDELADRATGAGAPRAHACDLGFGRDIVRLLAEAQAQLDSQKGTP